MPSAAAASSTRGPISLLRSPPELKAEAEVAANRKVWIKGPLLKDHGYVAVPRRQPLRRTAGNLNPARGGLLQPCEQPQRRRLAAAGGPHEGQQFVVLDLQAEVVHGPNPAGKDLTEMGDHDRRHARIVASAADFFNRLFRNSRPLPTIAT